MTQTEALRIALEAMEMFCEHGAILRPIETRDAIKAALEAKDEPVGEVLNERGEVDYISYVPPVGTALYTTPPQQEAKDEPVPVAIVEVFGKDWRLDYMALPVGKHKLYAQQYTYTTPPQRTWVGLTDEEIAEALGDEIDSVYMTDFRRVEAKLKEKNT
jgi:hypothetical protein